MKQNLEKLIKEQLENYEAPYDSTAWDQMADNLDARSNKGQTPRSSGKLFKLIAAAAVVTGITVIGYNYLFDSEDTVSNSSNLDLVKINEKDELTSTDGHQDEGVTDTNNFTQEKENLSTENEVKKTTNYSSNQTNEVVEKTETDPAEKTPTSTGTEKNTDVTSAAISDKKPMDDDRTPPVHRKFISGIISTTKICEGESVTISNKGDNNEFVRMKYDNTELIIPAGQQSQVTLNETTEIQFLDEDRKIMNVTNIVVYKNPQVDFSVESNVFEKGLPIVDLEAYGSYKSYNWKVDNKTYKGKSVQTHLFDKGTHNAQLTVVDHNNCKADKSRSISIGSDYNLMAVNGFKPKGVDHRNKTFMPYALTQRDVKFTMVIIDSRDHGIVYKTNDANQPWDGIDQRTGEMTASDRAYIWKVQLDNSLEGEKKVYVGTIVHD